MEKPPEASPSVLTGKSRGVVYIATGDRFHAEAVLSAESLKRHNPDLPCTLFTDKRRTDAVFDEQILITEPLFNVYDKCRNIHRTPYRQTLYLDADTYICDRLDAYFEALDYCDLAATIECARGFWYAAHSTLPLSLCDFNSGVFAFSSKPAVMECLRAWYGRCLQHKEWLSHYGKSQWMNTNDQPAFRELFWSNRDVRVAILPEEYNALRLFGTRLWGKAAIVHGRGDIARVAGEMNAHPTRNRVYLQGAGTILAFQELGLRQSLIQLFRIARAVLYFQGRRLFRSRPRD